jgi:hypothetical protein
MIRIPLHPTDPKGKEATIFVLEPGNITKIKRGEPLTIAFPERDIFIAFCPDIEWLTAELLKGVAAPGSPAKELDELLAEGLSRPEVDRDKDKTAYHPPIPINPGTGQA